MTTKTFTGRATITLHCADCLPAMREMPDNAFDLAIVDPPYGIGEDGGDKKRNRGYNRIVKHKKKQWDKRPESHYFNEIFRVSKNQMIFGANYFIRDIPKETMGWIFWDKMLGGDFSDGELIFTSFDRALRKCILSNFNGLKGGHLRIHPTQKPVALYKWLLKNYAKPGWKILDTHLGSGSIAIACWDMGFDLVGYEIDEDYFKAAVDRIEKHVAQQWIPGV